MNIRNIFILYALTIIKTSGAVDKCDVTVDITNGQRAGSSIIQNDIKFTENDYYYNGTQIIGCVCKVLNCVQDCCPSGQTLDTSSNTLHCISSRFEPYNNIKGPTLQHIIHVPDKQAVCREPSVKITLDSMDYFFELKDHGYLEWEGLSFHYKDYCISSLGDRVIAVVCVTEDSGLGSFFYCIGMIISMPFLLATFLVYAILPDRNLHQRALMLYVLTLCISYVLLVTVNLAVFDEPLCPIVGYLTMFFFMVSFFWINVICFDIWYTFSGGRGFVGSKRSSETRRFLLYNIYAWGVPLLHIGVVLLMQHIILPADSKHNPNVGTGKCFLNDGYPNLWYFYGEAGILIIINVILFLRTAFKIRQVKKETSMLKHSDSQRHAYEKDKQRFNLYLKLLFAMGVNWSMEVISWLVNWQTKNKYVEVWYLTDFFNAVYGVFIFFIFVFKKKTWKLLQKRYYNFVGKPHLAQTMTSSNTRTSHYSSTNYSTAETTLTDRTNGAGPEEVRLRQVS